MERLIPESDRQAAVRSVAQELISRNHGKIFREYWDNLISQNNPIPIGIPEGYYVNLFLKKELLPYCEAILKDDPKDNAVFETLVDMINKGKELGPLLLYFECHSSHAEYAGTAMAACYLDGNYEYAFIIHSKLDEDGFDS
jgi:hypothetical protein